jgi:hypothetical protein
MLRTFIQITSLILTLESAVFLAKGNLGLSAETIAELARTRLDYNAPVAASLAEQRGDTWVGVILLLLAFGLQMANALWPLSWNDFIINRRGVLCALVVSLLVGVASYYLSGELSRRTEIRVKKILETPAPEQPKGYKLG